MVGSKKYDVSVNTTCLQLSRCRVLVVNPNTIMVMSVAMTQSYEKCEENRVSNDTCGILTGWRMQTPAGPNGTNPTAIKNGRSFAATASAQQVRCKITSDININLQSSSFRLKQFSVIIFYWILYLFLCISIDQLIMNRIT